ncbi:MULTISPECIES: type 4a pilus biogenesis protein PilO [unclassified Oleiphilus]|uniref:type 4a pilus biogenesis protein PilO n=1 Tax=unclassified Oleiphilus TaxID=2631174 RepID=UPI0009EECBAF|nr:MULTISPECIES: type 4a pilus biogenesis protein PilO [unclassified Oleiphilus]
MGFSESMESLKGFDPNDIDFNNAGSWPAPVKAVVLVVVFLVLIVGGYFFLIQDQYTEFDRVAAEEANLKQQYESRAYKVANLEAFRLQMDDMKKSFGVLLKQLPAKTEVPGLLEDITNTGLGSGLEIESIQLKPEVSKEFYVELPMEIVVAGTYHDIASFVSGVASLPRIVTLHDMNISKMQSKSKGNSQGRSSHKLQMTVQAKTYRYGTEADREKSRQSKKKKGRRR